MSDKPTINRPWPEHAYVARYRNDIFVSYRSANNQNGWVTSFHKSLEQELYERLATSDFKIWRDSKLGGADDFSDTILKALCGKEPDTAAAVSEEENLGGSALLICIVSHAYLASPNCIDEIRLFQADPGPYSMLKINGKARVIPVYYDDRREVGKAFDALVPELRVNGFQFYEYANGNPQDFVRLDPPGGLDNRHPYSQMIKRLAEEVAVMMKTMMKTLNAALKER